MLYHKDIYMPKLPMPNGIFKLEYSEHAKREAFRDRYGAIRLPSQLITQDATIIEVEVINRKPTKILYRLPYDINHDIMLAVKPGEWFVKTVWINRKSDNHRTLDRSKYDC